MATPEFAYDLTIQPRRATAVDPQADQGWIYGLPPGITADQWPLDPNYGIPLQHGFTLLLPEDYRCHGPDIVGFSFFGPAMETLSDPWEAWPSLRQTILSGQTSGPLARPPAFTTPDGEMARWQTQGSAYTFHADTGWFDLAGGPPTPVLKENRAIQWTSHALSKASPISASIMSALEKTSAASISAPAMRSLTSKI